MEFINRIRYRLYRILSGTKLPPCQACGIRDAVTERHHLKVCHYCHTTMLIGAGSIEVLQDTIGGTEGRGQMMDLTEYERYLLKRHFQRILLLDELVSDEFIDSYIADQFERWAWTDVVDAEEIIRDLIRIGEEFEHGEG